jgi:hypothetical protein
MTTSTNRPTVVDRAGIAAGFDAAARQARDQSWQLGEMAGHMPACTERQRLSDNAVILRRIAGELEAMGAQWEPGSAP